MLILISIFRHLIYNIRHIIRQISKTCPLSYPRMVTKYLCDQQTFSSKKKKSLESRIIEKLQIICFPDILNGI